MLQRIQTLLLLLVLIASVAFYIFPTGTVELIDESEITVSLWGFKYFNTTLEKTVMMPGWYMVILNAFITLCTFITIILFKNRTIQVRFCIFNIIIQIGFLAMLFFYLYLCKQTATGLAFHTNILIVVPLAEIILTILAMRYILRDDALVKSIERLR